MTKEDEIETTFGEITEKNIGQLKVLHSAIFPVTYNDKFYLDLVESVQYSTLGKRDEPNRIDPLVLIRFILALYCL